jgi:predicted ATPase
VLAKPMDRPAPASRDRPPPAVPSKWDNEVGRPHHPQATSLALPATMSLARLWQRQGGRRETDALLAPISGWGTEGFDTADLQAAKALLEDLRT